MVPYRKLKPGGEMMVKIESDSSFEDRVKIRWQFSHSDELSKKEDRLELELVR